MNNKFRKNKKRVDPDNKKANDFINDTEVTGEPEKSDPEFPWENPMVREDVMKQYPSRFPEPLKLKIDFLVKHSDEISSINDYINKAVKEATKRDLQNFTQKNNHEIF